MDALLSTDIIPENTADISEKDGDLYDEYVLQTIDLGISFGGLHACKGYKI